MGIFNKLKSFAGLKKKNSGKTKEKSKKPKKTKVSKNTFKASKKIVKKTPKSVKKISKKPAKKSAKIKKIVKKIKTKKAAKPKKPKMEFKRMSLAGALKLIARKDAVEYIMAVSGEEGLKIMNFLFKYSKEIDEFTLAEKVGLQINFVRSILYKLYEKKLVSFSRERDKQKGWFIYSWLAHPDRLKEVLLLEKDVEITKLKEGMLNVQQVFYCNSCGKSYDYVQAMENTFFCAQCGNALEGLIQKESGKK